MLTKDIVAGEGPILLATHNKGLPEKVTNQNDGNHAVMMPRVLFMI